MTRNSEVMLNVKKYLRDFIGLAHQVFVEFYGGPLGGMFLYYWLWKNKYFITVIIYTIWYFYDLKTPEKCGRHIPFFHDTLVWRCIAEYFPIHLIKTQDLPSDRNYIFAAHPHGLLGFGIIPNFMTDSTGFSKKFPGIKSVTACFNMMFYFPFFRDYLLISNGISVSKKSIENFLKSGLGKAVCIVVGGTREILEAYPGSTTTVAKTRKGFVKLALTSGTDIVPCYTFGENDLYNQLHHKRGFGWLKSVWLAQIKLTGFSFPLPIWPIPKRSPLFTVVGRPIRVERTPNPSNEQIDLLHQKYLSELQYIFENNKVKYGMRADQHLEFI